jgi:hypothetical protein
MHSPRSCIQGDVLCVQRSLVQGTARFSTAYRTADGVAYDAAYRTACNTACSHDDSAVLVMCGEMPCH